MQNGTITLGVAESRIRLYLQMQRKILSEDLFMTIQARICTYSQSDQALLTKKHNQAFVKDGGLGQYKSNCWFMSENYKGEIVFRNTAYWVNYPELENIVRPIFSKNSLQGKGDIQGTISSFIVEKKSSKAIPYDENLGMVVQPETLNDIIDRLRLIIESESLPYYEYWNSLQSLYDFIKDKEGREELILPRIFSPVLSKLESLQSLYDYIKDKEGREELVPILGQFWQFKKAAILRLCNDSRYQEYMDAFVARRKMILDKQHISVPAKGIETTLQLLSEDCTIPFIARYRKDRTGNLDEVQIEQIAKLWKHYDEIAKRKESILKSIEEQDSLTEELRSKIEASFDLQYLEDLYLPYKKKKKTKA
ncbi:hypothetical protein FQR65_LT17750 [Abscondita terminalis]|nr:hypothetical protein FQR65_LT17750 [Abscondita terminalis]